MATTPRYPRHQTGGEVPASPRFPDLEQQVLAHWAADGTFQASVDNRPAGEDGSNEFVFYDGPPFANGLPHYGHLLTGYVKDVVGRSGFGIGSAGLPAYNLLVEGRSQALENDVVLSMKQGNVAAASRVVTDENVRDYF